MGAEFTWVYARTFGSMRELPRPDIAEAVVAQVPSRTALQAETAHDQTVPARAVESVAEDAPGRTTTPGTWIQALAGLTLLFG